jgi:hypothetical protein
VIQSRRAVRAWVAVRSARRSAAEIASGRDTADESDDHGTGAPITDASQGKRSHANCLGECDVSFSPALVQSGHGSTSRLIIDVVTSAGE